MNIRIFDFAESNRTPAMPKLGIKTVTTMLIPKVPMCAMQRGRIEGTLTFWNKSSSSRCNWCNNVLLTCYKITVCLRWRNEILLSSPTSVAISNTLILFWFTLVILYIFSGMVYLSYYAWITKKIMWFISIFKVRYIL